MCFYERTCSGSSGRNAGTAGNTSRKAGQHEGVRCLVVPCKLTALTLDKYQRLYYVVTFSLLLFLHLRPFPRNSYIQHSPIYRYVC